MDLRLNVNIEYIKENLGSIRDVAIFYKLKSLFTLNLITIKGEEVSEYGISFPSFMRYKKRMKELGWMSNNKMKSLYDVFDLKRLRINKKRRTIIIGKKDNIQRIVNKLRAKIIEENLIRQRLAIKNKFRYCYNDEKSNDRNPILNFKRGDYCLNNVDVNLSLHKTAELLNMSVSQARRLYLDNTSLERHRRYKRINKCSYNDYLNMVKYGMLKVGVNFYYQGWIWENLSSRIIIKNHTKLDMHTDVRKKIVYVKQDMDFKKELVKSYYSIF